MRPQQNRRLSAVAVVSDTSDNTEHNTIRLHNSSRHFLFASNNLANSNLAGSSSLELSHHRRQVAPSASVTVSDVVASDTEPSSLVRVATQATTTVAHALDNNGTVHFRAFGVHEEHQDDHRLVVSHQRQHHEQSLADHHHDTLLLPQQQHQQHQQHHHHEHQQHQQSIQHTHPNAAVAAAAAASIGGSHHLSGHNLSSSNYHLLQQQHHLQSSQLLQLQQQQQQQQQQNVAPTATFDTTFITCILSLIIFITFIGNILVCLSVIRVRKLRHPSNYLLVSLAISDLCVALFVMPFGLYYSVNEQWRLGTTLCDVYVSFDVTSCTASILNLCVISVDRWMAITRPLTYGVKRTTKLILTFIAIVWITSCLITVPPLLISGNEYGTEAAPKCEVSQSLFYQLYATLSAFYIPLAVMLSLYYQIYKSAKRVAEAEQRSTLGQQHNDHHYQHQLHQQRLKRQQQQQQQQQQLEQQQQLQQQQQQQNLTCALVVCDGQAINELIGGPSQLTLTTQPRKSSLASPMTVKTNNNAQVTWLEPGNDTCGGDKKAAQQALLNNKNAVAMSTIASVNATVTTKPRHQLCGRCCQGSDSSAGSTSTAAPPAESGGQPLECGSLLLANEQQHHQLGQNQLLKHLEQPQMKLQHQALDEQLLEQQEQSKLEQQQQQQQQLLLSVNCKEELSSCKMMALNDDSSNNNDNDKDNDRGNNSYGNGCCITSTNNNGTAVVCNYNDDDDATAIAAAANNNNIDVDNMLNIVNCESNSIAAAAAAAAAAGEIQSSAKQNNGCSCDDAINNHHHNINESADRLQQLDNNNNSSNDDCFNPERSPLLKELCIRPIDEDDSEHDATRCHKCTNEQQQQQRHIKTITGNNTQTSGTANMIDALLSQKQMMTMINNNNQSVLDCECACNGTMGDHYDEDDDDDEGEHEFEDDDTCITNRCLSPKNELMQPPNSLSSGSAAPYQGQSALELESAATLRRQFCDTTQTPVVAIGQQQQQELNYNSIATSQQQQPMRYQQTMQQVNSNNGGGSKRRRTGSVMRERKASFTLGVIMGAFTICWLPFFILALLRPFSRTVNELPRAIVLLCLWLGYANSLLNPIIYVTFHHDFRHAFKHLLLFRCMTINEHMRKEEYRFQYGDHPATAANANKADTSANNNNNANKAHKKLSRLFHYNKNNKRCQQQQQQHGSSSNNDKLKQQQNYNGDSTQATTITKQLPNSYNTANDCNVTHNNNNNNSNNGNHFWNRLWRSRRRNHNRLSGGGGGGGVGKKEQDLDDKITVSLTIDCQQQQTSSSNEHHHRMKPDDGYSNCSPSSIHGRRVNNF